MTTKTNPPLCLFGKFFDKPATRYNSRQSLNLYCKRPRTNFSAQSVSQKIVALWNKCPDELKQIKLRKTFKNSILQKYIDSYNDFVHCDKRRCRQCYP